MARKTSNVRGFPSAAAVAGMSPQETATACLLLANYRSNLNLVKADWESIYKRPITFDTLNRIATIHASDIQTKAEELVGAPENNPLGCPAMRLIAVGHLYRLAIGDENLRKVVKKNRLEVETVRDKDPQLALACIALAQKIDQQTRMLESKDPVNYGDYESDCDDDEDGLGFGKVDAM